MAIKGENNSFKDTAFPAVAGEERLPKIKDVPDENEPTKGTEAKGCCTTTPASALDDIVK